MTLIKSISGIRGTIGGREGENLTPFDIVSFTAAFSSFIKKRSNKERIKLVIGRDARISGEIVSQLVSSTAQAMSVDIVDLGLSTTPTVEIAVPYLNADGGIILTASHNPKQWNALKLLNEKGEFISAQDGALLLDMIEKGGFEFSDVDSLGTYEENTDFIDIHIDEVLKLKLVDVDLIKNANFSIALNCVNSTGGIALPRLLEKLGVKSVSKYLCEPNGDFPANPEPLPENLIEFSNFVKEHDCDLGFVVDPDVDRLAIVNEDGSVFGEEFTLVAVADYVLKNTPGSTVSNLSSSRALRDVTNDHSNQYFASAVGEVNVVEMMKEKKAIIGGEGNGGIIYPESHYGRDALVGVGLLLTSLALKDKSISKVFKELPKYHMLKEKINIDANLNFNVIKIKLKSAFQNYSFNETDGLKIENNSSWIHVRKSNTEPIIRIYIESKQVEISKSMFNSVKKALS